MVRALIVPLFGTLVAAGCCSSEDSIGGIDLPTSPTVEFATDSCLEDVGGEFYFQDQGLVLGERPYGA